MPEEQQGEMPVQDQTTPDAATTVTTPASVTPPVETPGTPTLEQVTAELEKARAALKAANREAAERRKKLDEFETAEQKRKEAEMTELQKLQARTQQLEAERDTALQQANDRLIKSAFVAEAAKAGAAHPEDAYALADLAGVSIAEGGNVQGVAEAVEAVVKAGRLPLVAGRPVAPRLDGGAGSGDRSTRLPQLSEEELKVAHKLGVKPEVYQAMKAGKQE